LETGRRPFLVNIGGGVLVPLMGCAATGTGPQPITQGDGMIDEATDIAAFGGREKAVDVMDMRAVLPSIYADSAEGKRAFSVDKSMRRPGY
jgi:hypothetical protein